LKLSEMKPLLLILLFVLHSEGLSMQKFNISGVGSFRLVLDEDEDIFEDDYLYESTVVIGESNVVITISGLADVADLNKSIESLKKRLSSEFPSIRSTCLNAIKEIDNDAILKMSAAATSAEDARVDLKLREIVYYVDGSGFGLWFRSRNFFYGKDLNVEYDKRHRMSFYKLDG